MSDTDDVQAVASLLGGPRVLRQRLTDRLAAHELLVRGLPAQALWHLIDRLETLPKTTSLGKAVGMSLRTFQRRRDGPSKPLSPEQSGRTWKFAEILTRAAAVFGSMAEAEQWLEQPAMGLEQRRPIDLLCTPAGVEMVEALLTRLKYGVYT